MYLMRWDDISNRKHLRPKIIEETIEKIKMIRKYLLAVQSRQKSYIDNRICYLKFNVEDHIFLEVSLAKVL